MTPKEIEKKLASLFKRRTKVSNEIIEFKRSIKDICHHPKQYIHKFEVTNDDGYGKFWTVKNIECQICGKRKVDNSVEWI